VPGAIEGRKSLHVEVSAMNGIPEAALDAFEEQLAEEMLADYPGPVARLPANAAPPVEEDEEEEEDEPPPLPKELEVQDKATLPATLGNLLEKPIGMPGLAWVANQLANSDGQYANLLNDTGEGKDQKKKTGPPGSSQEVKAFDPSMLAQRLSCTNTADDLAAWAAESARAEEEAQAKRDSKKRKEEEKAQFANSSKSSFSFGFMKPAKEQFKATAPQVPQVDKNVLADVGFALKARAAEARAAARGLSNQKVSVVNLRSKLAAMQAGGLLKFAVDCGVAKDDIMKSKSSKDFLIQIILQLETEEAWKTVTFKPGDKVGIKADWARGEVESVTQGEQGDIQRVEVGWVFKTIGGERYSKALLQAKISGVVEYKVVFGTNEFAKEKSRQNGGGRYEPGGARRRRPIEREPEVELEKVEEALEAQEEASKGRAPKADGAYDPEDRQPGDRHADRGAEQDGRRPEREGRRRQSDRHVEEYAVEEEMPRQTNGRRRFQEGRRPREERYEPEQGAPREREPRERERGDRQSRRYDDNRHAQDNGRRRFKENERRTEDNAMEEDEYEYEEEEEEEEEADGRERESKRRRTQDYDEEGAEEAKPKGDANRKRGAARLLPREEKSK